MEHGGAEILQRSRNYETASAHLQLQYDQAQTTLAQRQELIGLND